MRMYGNEIAIHQGESFTIDKLIVNEDGSPYIVGNLNTPRWEINISDSDYGAGQFFKTYQSTEIKHFTYTTPIKISDIYKSKTNAGTVHSPYTDFPTQLVTEDKKDYIGYGYLSDGRLVAYEPNDAVFYKETDGKKDYRYWDVEANSWKSYECPIIVVFPSSDTVNWVPRTYYWNIRLVAVDSENNPFTIDILPPTKLSVYANLKGVN